MRRTSPKSHCPVNYALEAIGDPWSLLIVRDIVFHNKQTFREFLRSDEKIATNILQARLSSLLAQGILYKAPHPTDRRKEVYSLTKKGEALIPILTAMVHWSARFDPATSAAQLESR
jgi:DNA-binding HxlR family transcriptional regulator